MTTKKKITEAVADSASDQRKLDAAKKVLDGVFGKRMAVGSNSEVDEVIPTGLEVVDRYVLGIGGWPVRRVCELFSDPSAGKAQPISTLLPTPNGWRRLGDLRPGDLVFGSDGKPTQVLGVFPQGRKRTYRVHFRDGASTRCCGQHLWAVNTKARLRRGHAVLVRSTKELLNDLHWKGPHGIKEAKWRVQLAAPVQFPEADLPVDPYVMGALLGDGCLTRGACISMHNPELAARVLARLPTGDSGVFDGKWLRIRRAVRGHDHRGVMLQSTTLATLSHYGLRHRAEAKFVPAPYLLGSVEQRLELLRGIFDTDGHADKGYVDFGTVSAQLAEDVVTLVRSLGGVAQVRVKGQSTYEYRGETRQGQIVYRVCARLDDLIPVTLSKHLARYKRTERIPRTLTRIERDRIEESVCIKVAAQNGLYVTEDFIVTHNTSLGFAALASAQREGGLAILIETEDALQVARATIFGVNLSEVFLSEPVSIEDVLEGIRLGLAAIPEGVGPNLIVWDSIAMSALAATNEKGQGAKGVGRKAALMSEQWPSLTRAAADKRTAMLLINQSRTKIGLVFGNPTTTPGGDTHKFTASIRLQMWASSSPVKQGDKEIGVDTTIKAVKNKLAIPFRKTKIRLLFESGWDDRWSTVTHAKDQGVIKDSVKMSDAAHAEARRALGWSTE